MLDQQLSTPLIERTPEETKTTRCSKWGPVLLTLLLHGLMAIQFNQAHNARIGGFGTVNFSVGLFSLTSALLRKTLAYSQIISGLTHLMPECIALLATILVYCQDEVTGFLVMVFGTLTMSVVIFWLASQMLFALNQEESKAPAKSFPKSEIHIQVV